MKKLTDTEWEVMQMVAHGYQNKEISDILKCSIKTVEKHKQSVYYKWHVNCAIAMIRVGLREGLISYEDFIFSKVGEGCHHEMPQSHERILA